MSLKFFIPFLFLIPSSLLSQTEEFNKPDANGRKHGPWRAFYPNQKLRYEGVFEHGRPIGLMKKYHKNGNISARIFYEKDTVTSRAKLYYESGHKAAEGKFTNRKKDSTWNYYSFYNRRLALKEDWKHGVKHGLEITFYDNGKQAEILEWKNGLKNGKWEQYYENDALRLKSTWVNGKREGKFESYNPDGSPSVFGNYKNDLMEGEWLFYPENSDEPAKLKYSGGKMLSTPDTEKLQKDFSNRMKDILNSSPSPEINFR